MTKKYSADDIVLAKQDESLVGSDDLTEAGFVANLSAATDKALSFAKTLVTNQLVGELRYLVLDPCNNVHNWGEAELVFEGELRYISFNSLDDVKKILWKSGSIPEWVNIYVSSEIDSITYIKFDYSSRFIDDPKFLFHIEKGIAPFHVLGPPVPKEFDLTSGDKYRI